MYLSFQSINNNSTKFEVEKDKENTWKEKDDKNVDFFFKRKIHNTYILNNIKFTC